MMGLAALLGMLLLGISFDALSNDDRAEPERDTADRADRGDDTPVVDTGDDLEDEVQTIMNALENGKEPMLFESFDAESDVIVIELGPDANPDPEVSMVTEGESSVLSLDGEAVARIHAINGAVTPESVRLVSAA